LYSHNSKTANYALLIEITSVDLPMIQSVADAVSDAIYNIEQAALLRTNGTILHTYGEYSHLSRTLGEVRGMTKEYNKLIADGNEAAIRWQHGISEAMALGCGDQT
jgi:hypothetical protein